MERDAGGRFAWEADTLPAELLPLGSLVILVERSEPFNLRREASVAASRLG